MAASREKMTPRQVRTVSTILIGVCHHLAPLPPLQGPSDGGVTWKTEAIVEEQVGYPKMRIASPPERTITALCAGPIAKSAAHRETAQDRLRLIRSEAVPRIVRQEGFWR